MNHDISTQRSIMQLQKRIRCVQLNTMKVLRHVKIKAKYRKLWLYFFEENENILNCLHVHINTRKMKNKLINLPTMRRSGWKKTGQHFCITALDCFGIYNMWKCHVFKESSEMLMKVWIPRLHPQMLWLTKAGESAQDVDFQ